jgi:hypothetical protein
MIIIRLKGGLGNQMFQYAFGRYLSLRNNDTLKLDKSFLEKPARGYTKREYELGIFNIKEKFTQKEEIPLVVKRDSFFNKFLLKFFKRRLYLLGIKYYPEANLEKALNAKGNLYLDGYWQDCYFPNAIRSTLTKEFSLKREEEFLKGQNKEAVKEMKKSPSVSVHIRRTDYVAIDKNKQAFSYCNQKYYKKAIETIKEKIKEPKFFFFSDDINWVKNSIKIKDAVYVDWNKKNPCYDMTLMSNCQNHIIANSTFAWWSAWLSKDNKNKIVVAPKIWSRGDNQKNIVPQNWIKI